MSTPNIVLAQGESALGFQVFDHAGRGADAFNKCASVAARGDLVFFTGKNIVSVASGGVGASAKLAGFIENNVLASIPGNQRIDWHDEYVTKDVDPVSVWRKGRVRVTNVSGTVGDNVLVYPAADGALAASQTGSDPAAGIAREGNGGVAGGPIVVEFDLTAHGA